MHSLYFDDWEVGQTFISSGRTIVDSDVISFVTSTGMLEDLFLDEEYIRSNTPFKRRIAPGAMVFAFSEGLFLQLGLIHKSAIAFLGLEELRVMAPTFVGDTIHVEAEITAKRLVKSEDRGIVSALHRVLNQSNAEVLRFRINRMLKRST